LHQVAFPFSWQPWHFSWRYLLHAPQYNPQYATNLESDMISFTFYASQFAYLEKMNVKWCLMPIVATINTISFMNTNDPTAFWTYPLFLFLFNEFSYTDLLYGLKIVDHAHTIFCSVTLI
jgi:hypothetical protein